MSNDGRAKDLDEGSSEYLVRAAVACFARQGVLRTTMGDVAREAEVSRAALYYHFPNRTALVVEVVLREADRILQRIESQLGRDSTSLTVLIDAIGMIIEASIVSEYAALFTGAAGTEKLTASVVNHDRIRARQREFWTPLFEAARESGELRHGLTDSELLEFIAVTECALLMVGDELGIDSADARRAHLDRFVAPALASDVHAVGGRASKRVGESRASVH